MKKTGIQSYFGDEFWNGMTLFGTPNFYVFILLLSYCLTRSSMIPSLVGAFIVLELLCFVLKMLIPKKRPEHTANHTYPNVYDSRSFPSIHTARITLLTYAACLVSAPVGALFTFVAVIVAISRIVLRKHDLLDVVGGVLTGLIVGYLWRLL